MAAWASLATPSAREGGHFVKGRKLTEEISDEVRFVLGKAEARCFYTRTKKKKGLGWSDQRFDQVDFRARGAALAGKPDAYGI